MILFWQKNSPFFISFIRLIVATQKRRENDYNGK